MIVKEGDKSEEAESEKTDKEKTDDEGAKAKEDEKSEEKPVEKEEEKKEQPEGEKKEEEQEKKEEKDKKEREEKKSDEKESEKAEKGDKESKKEESADEKKDDKKVSELWENLTLVFVFSVKPRPNDRNISTRHTEHNMLFTFIHPFEICFNLSSPVNRAPTLCLGGLGFPFPVGDSIDFLCYTLASCSLVHFFKFLLSLMFTILIHLSLHTTHSTLLFLVLCRTRVIHELS